MFHLAIRWVWSVCHHIYVSSSHYHGYWVICRWLIVLPPNKHTGSEFSFPALSKPLLRFPNCFLSLFPDLIFFPQRLSPRVHHKPTTFLILGKSHKAEFLLGLDWSITTPVHPFSLSWWLPSISGKYRSKSIPPSSSPLLLGTLSTHEQGQDHSAWSLLSIFAPQPSTSSNSSYALLFCGRANWWWVFVPMD